MQARSQDMVLRPPPGLDIGASSINGPGVMQARAKDMVLRPPPGLDTDADFTERFMPRSVLEYGDASCPALQQHTSRDTEAELLSLASLLHADEQRAPDDQIEMSQDCPAKKKKGRPGKNKRLRFQRQLARLSDVLTSTLPPMNLSSGMVSRA